MRTTLGIGALALMALYSTPALAQTQDPRVRLSFGAATTAGAIDSEVAFLGSAGYRFTDRFSFDVEVVLTEGPADRFLDRPFILENSGITGMGQFGSLMAGRATPGATQRGSATPATIRAPAGFPIGPGGPGGIGGIGLGGLRGETDGDTILATVGFRYAFPVQGGRLRPYAGAGLGVARTDEEFSLIVPQPLAGNVSRLPLDFDGSVSHTGLAASLGVGASLRVFKELSLDIDARYFRLDRDRNLGLFGGGVSYRF